jgi:hypothetical protein
MPAVPDGVLPPMFAPSGWVVKTTCVEPEPIENEVDDAPAEAAAVAVRKYVRTRDGAARERDGAARAPVQSGLFVHASEPDPDRDEAERHPVEAGDRRPGRVDDLDDRVR